MYVCARITFERLRFFTLSSAVIFVFSLLSAQGLYMRKKKLVQKLPELVVIENIMKNFIITVKGHHLDIVLSIYRERIRH